MEPRDFAADPFAPAGDPIEVLEAKSLELADRRREVFAYLQADLAFAGQPRTWPVLASAPG